MASSPDTSQEPIVIILMGVSGAGKTTIGEELARRTGWSFVDGDDFHPPANVEKMSAGTPLVDSDRVPWLKAIRTYIDECIRKKQAAIVACSALKARYRSMLNADRPGVHFVYLKGSYEQIAARLASRTGHFFDGELLTTQFDALEPPDASEALIVTIDQSPERIVSEILQALSLSQVSES